MNNIWLALAGFAVIVAFMLALTVRGAGQWRRKLDDILLPIGFVRCDAASDKDVMARRLLFVNPRHQGRRLLMHLYRRDAPQDGCTLYVGDYRFASAGGRTSGGNWVIVALVAPALGMPRLCIDGIPQDSATVARLARALGERQEPPGLRRVTSGDAAMDARFQVHLGSTEESAAMLPAVLQILADALSAPSLDAQGDTLVLSSASMMADRIRQVLDTQKLHAQLHLAQQLFGALGRH
jgi:hypothetical protein